MTLIANHQSTARADGYGRRGPTASRFVDDGVGAMSGPRLLVALYDRLIVDLAVAMVALEGPTPLTGDAIYQAHERLTHAQRIVEELQFALDPDAWDGAETLGSVYEFLHGRLVAANIGKDAAIVAECHALLIPLAEAWREAAEAIETGAVPVAPTPVQAIA